MCFQFKSFIEVWNVLFYFIYIYMVILKSFPKFAGRFFRFMHSRADIILKPHSMEDSSPFLQFRNWISFIWTVTQQLFG